MAVAALLVLPTRSSAADAATEEWHRLNAALAWGIGGAAIGYYAQKMNSSVYHHLMPPRFKPAESAFVLGGWFLILSYTGYGAALANAGTAQASAGDNGQAMRAVEQPVALPQIGVDGDGHAIVGATLQF